MLCRVSRLLPVAHSLSGSAVFFDIFISLLSLVADADRVLVMGDGHVIEFDSPYRLLFPDTGTDDERKSNKDTQEGQTLSRRASHFASLVAEAGSHVRDRILSHHRTSSSSPR